jgi:hypothetical protein
MVFLSSSRIKQVQVDQPQSTGLSAYNSLYAVQCYSGGLTPTSWAVSTFALDHHTSDQRAPMWSPLALPSAAATYFRVLTFIDHYQSNRGHWVVLQVALFFYLELQALSTCQSPTEIDGCRAYLYPALGSHAPRHSPSLGYRNRGPSWIRYSPNGRGSYLVQRHLCHRFVSLWEISAPTRETPQIFWEPLQVSSPGW